MNSYRDPLSWVTGLTAILLVAKPGFATENSITGINLEKLNNKLELKLTTQGNARASYFTVRNDNTIETNLLDTELNLPTGDSFSQKNPFPGIATIEVAKVDNQNTRVVFTVEKELAVEPDLQQQGKEMVLSLERSPEANKLQQLGRQAIESLKQTYRSIFGSNDHNKNELKPTTKLAQNTSPEITINDSVENPPASNSQPAPIDPNLVQNNTSPDVLVPNPDIEITGGTPNNLPGASSNLPTLPRAVAPPVGDMAVSNIDASPDLVDLGTDTLVPRLVLRDAPVREVLSILARTAGLDIVFSLSNKEEAQTNEEGEVIGPTITLDLENQSIQEAFNSVLLVSGLNANRKGNIIYISDRLPTQARNLVSRTLRLNQVRAENAALYLASLGAQGQRLTTEVEETIDPETGRVVQRVELPATLEDLSGSLEDENGMQALLLQGLQVSTDDRLNSITLVGEPRKVEIATSYLTQLDARRRQVAVNVKVVDVNLLNQDIFNSSFSFGVNDSFFVQDNGSATLRFGERSPATSGDISSHTGRAANPPVITNPFAGAETFIDLNNPNNSFSIPGTTPGLINDGQIVRERGTGNFFGRVAGISEDPFTASLTDFTRAGFDEITVTETEEGVETTFTRGEDGTATLSLPGLFQYPDKFLALLEARVSSGNAKILTDPTLMVQEGQQATVKLAQNIVESVETSIDAESGARTITPVIGEAGVVLTVNIERIDDNGFISLSVSPTVSSVGQTQEFDSGGGATNILNLLSKRELSSGLVRLRDGQTLILSGIIQDQERTTVSKVPILGDIPLLGSLFRSTDKANERAEVIVLLTPQIVDEDSNFGYNYTPGKESREVLREGGVELPGNP